MAIVRNYPTFCKIRDGIYYESPPPNEAGGHVKNGKSDPTAAKALRGVTVEEQIRAVDKALDRMPTRYRKGIMDNIIFGTPMLWLDGAGERSWQRWRKKFLYDVYHLTYFR